MLPEIVRKMPWPPEFHVNHTTRKIQLHDESKGEAPSTACNAAFARVVGECIDKNLFQIIDGRHSEPFEILGANYPVQIERYAVPLFGIAMRGAHMTVYTTTPEGMKIWIPRRSGKIWASPGKLDTTVGGGVAAHETPFENLCREADEEASLPTDLVKKYAKSCGVLTYVGVTDDSICETGLIFPDVVYVYDLEVAADVVPKPNDDEVEGFYLMSVEQVKTRLLNREFKANSAVVVIDFFVRHGIITAENEERYVEMMARMHRKLPVPTSPH